MDTQKLLFLYENTSNNSIDLVFAAYRAQYVKVTNATNEAVQTGVGLHRDDLYLFHCDIKNSELVELENLPSWLAECHRLQLVVLDRPTTFDQIKSLVGLNKNKVVIWANETQEQLPFVFLPLVAEKPSFIEEFYRALKASQSIRKAIVSAKKASEVDVSFITEKLLSYTHESDLEQWNIYIPDSINFDWNALLKEWSVPSNKSTEALPNKWESLKGFPGLGPVTGFPYHNEPLENTGSYPIEPLTGSQINKDLFSPLPTAGPADASNTPIRPTPPINISNPNKTVGIKVTDYMPTESDSGAVYKVWYGTNRKPLFAQSDIMYSQDRDSETHYGVCYVNIPKTHKMGSTGSSWWRRLFTMVDDRIKIDEIQVQSIEQFILSLKDATEVLAPDSKAGVVFIHGYNVSFDEAAIRAAQLGFDLKIKGPMSFFSWPSQGSVEGYIADEATIEASESQITDFLKLFATQSGVDTVHIIAHSMGNRALLRAVQRIVNLANESSNISFGHFILAAPDVDSDVFRQLATAYKQVAKHTTLYISDKDKALQASGFLHRHPRAGIAPPVTVVPNIDTIHVGEVDLSFLGHGYVAEAREVLYDMHELIFDNKPADNRVGIRPTGQGYWRISG